jgi:hypothetical protein
MIRIIVMIIIVIVAGLVEPANAQPDPSCERIGLAINDQTWIGLHPHARYDLYGSMPGIEVAEDVFDPEWIMLPVMDWPGNKQLRIRTPEPHQTITLCPTFTIWLPIVGGQK